MSDFSDLPTPPGPDSVSKRPVWFPVALIVVALLIGIPAVIKSAVPLSHSIGVGSPINTPATTQISLDKGKYSIYALSGSKTQTGSFTYSENRLPNIPPTELIVTGTDNQRVEVRSSTPNATIQRNSAIYTRIANIDIPTTGRYELEANTKDKAQLLFAPTFSQTFSEIRPWFVVGLVAWLMFLLGVGLLIFWAVRRHAKS